MLERQLLSALPTFIHRQAKIRRSGAGTATSRKWLLTLPTHICTNCSNCFWPASKMAPHGLAPLRRPRYTPVFAGFFVYTSAPRSAQNPRFFLFSRSYRPFFSKPPAFAVLVRNFQTLAAQGFAGWPSPSSRWRMFWFCAGCKREQLVRNSGKWR